MIDSAPIPGCRLLVLGYGNTLRSDDGAGVRVAAAVAASGLPGVSALAVHQLTPELADRLAVAERAIFVDARLALEGADLAIASAEPRDSVGMTPHISDPGSLLAMTQWLHGRSPRSWLFTVPGVDFSIGEGISTTTDRGIHQALAQIAGWLSTSDSPALSAFQDRHFQR